MSKFLVFLFSVFEIIGLCVMFKYGPIPSLMFTWGFIAIFKMCLVFSEPSEYHLGLKLVVVPAAVAGITMIVCALSPM